MDIKWIGAVLIVTGCGGFGFSLAALHRREEQGLRNLLNILDFMTSELLFRATPLPELCVEASRQGGRELRAVFSALAEALNEHISPDAARCMDTALCIAPELTEKVRENLRFLSRNMGRFDLDGQLRGLEAARLRCKQDLEALTAGREVRLRNYQTLSLCTGAALAILLL